jgi:hypothetical protein
MEDEKRRRLQVLTQEWSRIDQQRQEAEAALAKVEEEMRDLLGTHPSSDPAASSTQQPSSIQSTSVATDAGPGADTNLPIMYKVLQALLRSGGTAHRAAVAKVVYGSEDLVKRADATLQYLRKWEYAESMQGGTWKITDAGRKAMREKEG